MASRDIALCDRRLQDVWAKTLVKWASYHPEITPFLTCTYRSPEEQDALYAQGRTTEGQIVTNARRFESGHNFKPSQAYDIGFKNADGTLNWSLSLFHLFADIVHAIDPTIVWGGVWRTIKDNPHFETPDWHKLKGTVHAV